MKSLLRAVALGLGLMLTAATAFADYESELYAKAKKEGELVWYTTLIVKQAVRPLVAAFQKKYPGIKVRYSRANSSGTATKVLSEGKANRIIGDVFDGTSNAEALKDANLVEKWTPKGSSAYPSQYRDPDGFWSATHQYFLTPGINTSLIPKAEAPKTYDDLLDPKWKGKMAWSPRSTTSGAAGFIGNMLISRGEEKGMAYLRQLAKQEIIPVSASARKVLDQAIAGEYPMALQIFNHHTVISGRKGRAGGLDSHGTGDQHHRRHRRHQGGSPSQRRQAPDRVHAVEGRAEGAAEGQLPAGPPRRAGAGAYPEAQGRQVQGQHHGAQDGAPRAQEVEEDPLRPVPLMPADARVV